MRQVQRLSLLALIFVSVHADFSEEIYSAKSSLNKTVFVVWPLGSTEGGHAIRCIADGVPLPTLRWTIDDDKEDFKGNATIIVDTSNTSEILIHFKNVDYPIIHEYHCSAYNSTKHRITQVDFNILVDSTNSKAKVVGILILLIVFVTLVVGICRYFQFNRYAALMEM